MKFGLCLLCLFVTGRLAAVDAPTSAVRTNLPVHAAPKISDFPKNVQLERGFRLELVATEPLIGAPIAMAFDENGRMFVLEKSDAVGNGVGLGRVRLLEDIDGDGVYDGSSIYADNLNNPTALICYGGGVFVACGGQIQYLRDTAFDGSADVHRDIFKSLGEATNGVAGQVMITGMAWGLDNRIHVSTAGHGGDVISSSTPVQSVILTDGNFSFDPRTYQLAPENGHAASGISFDNRGQLLAANHDGPLQMVMYESRYAVRNANTEMPGAVLNVPGNAQQKNFSFSTDSIAIYRGSAFPADYSGDLFAVDTARGIVRRTKLRQHGIELIADSPAPATGADFLTASNNFHPTQVLSGPDGALYIAGTLTTPAATPRAPASVKGCVYRIVPLNFKQPKPPQLSRATDDQLVLLLRHPNGWLRDAAARLLYERQNRAAIVPLIRLVFDLQSPPLARMHALHALDSLHVTADGRAGNALLEPHITKALGDTDERVRQHAVLLAERFISPEGIVSDGFWTQLSGLAGDASPLVRYQLAFTLGDIRHVGRGQLLAQILRADPTNIWTQAAVASSLDEGAAEMLDSLVGDATFRNGPGGGEFLRHLFEIVGAKNRPAEVALAINDLTKIPEPQLAFTIARAFDNSLQRADDSLAVADGRGALQPLFQNAARVILDESANENARVAAMRALSGVTFVEPDLSVALLQLWPRLSARLRREGIALLLSRPGTTDTLLRSMQIDWVSKTELTSAQVRFLFTFNDPILSGDVAIIYGKSPDSSSRQGIVNRFAPSLQIAGRAQAGREIFAARCAACHQASGLGNRIGLALADAAKSGKGHLLVKIIDPGAVPPTAHPATLVQTAAGESLFGFITSENSKSLTLCDAVGAEHVVGHSNLRANVPLGFSMMPTGLENGLTQQDMADLLAFVF